MVLAYPWHMGSHWGQRRQRGQSQRFKRQTRAWEGGWQVSSPTWGHAINTGRRGCFIKHPETSTDSQGKWSLHTGSWISGNPFPLPGTPTFTEISSSDHRPSALLVLPSHQDSQCLIMSQKYQKVLLQQFTGRSLLFKHLPFWSLRFSLHWQPLCPPRWHSNLFLWSLLRNKWWGKTPWVSNMLE